MFLNAVSSLVMTAALLFAGPETERQLTTNPEM